LPGARTFSGGVQKIPKFEINDRIVLQPHTWYTCPTGKKAIVKGRIQCTGRGAAASASFEAAGVIMFTWVSGSGSIGWEQSPRALNDGSDEFALFEVELSAGDIIETTQNSGTNAEFNLWADVQETPV